MTVLTDDKIQRNGDGGHRDLRDVITQIPGRLDTHGHTHRGGGTLPARILGSVRESPVLQSGSLERLAPLTSYSWFSQGHFQQALEWLDVILKLCGSSHNADRQAVGWLIPAILDLYRKDVDLYHHARAVRAAEVIPGRAPPQRREQIPLNLWAHNASYTLRMSSLSWGPGTPIEATNRLSAISLQAMPDTWWLATYEEQRSRRTYDPIIYAQYGDWYVEIARWDDPQ